MLAAGNIHYDMADRTRAIAPGGIGTMHLLVKKFKLAEAIDKVSTCARLRILRTENLPSNDSYFAVLEGIIKNSDLRGTEHLFETRPVWDIHRKLPCILADNSALQSKGVFETWRNSEDEPGGRTTTYRCCF